MAEDIKYLDKALVVVIDDDEHGRSVFSWSAIGL
jgi:hypothetical protein